MLPVVPASLLKLSDSFTDVLRVRDNAGRRAYTLYGKDNVVCGASLYRHTRGFLDEGISYSIDFDDCKNNTVTKIHTRRIVVSFGPLFEDGPKIEKEIGERQYDISHYKENFTITAAEALSLHPPNGQQVTQIPIEVKFTLKSACGNRIRRSPKYNFYERNWDSTIIVLLAEAQTIYANLNLLAINSHFFKCISEHLEDLSKDERSGLPLLKMEEHRSCIFHHILRLVYPSNISRIPHKRRDISDALRLADYLNLEVILMKYEKWLASDEENYYATPCQKLLWGQLYAMGYLQSCVFDQMKTISCVLKVRKHPLFNTLPKEVMGIVVDKMAEIIKDGGKYDYKSGEEDGSFESEDSDE